MNGCTRPFIFRDYQEIADHIAATLEGVRDITIASHLIGDMSESTFDDPLSAPYKKLGCLVSVLEKNSNDYDMIVKYFEKTYDPMKVDDVVRMKMFLFVSCTIARMQKSSLVYCLLAMNFRNMGCQLKTSLLWNQVLSLIMKVYSKVDK